MTLAKKNINYNFSLIVALLMGLTQYFVTSSVFAQPSQRLLLSDDIIVQTQQLSTREQLDVINNINSQRSAEAKALIDSLVQQHAQQPLDNIDALRLSLLHCFNLLEFGEFNQAIILAKQGEINARQYKYDTARPYFIQCQAEAQQNLGNVLQEQILTEESLRLANLYSEKQAIVNNLYNRSRQNTSLENYNASIEDLRLALASYEEAQNQPQHWYLLPISFIQSEISNVFLSLGDYQEALNFSEEAYKDISSFGKIKSTVIINLALINIALKDKFKVLYYLDKIKNFNTEIDSERDIAYQYALLAMINLYVGNYDIAEQKALSSINIFTKYQEPIYVMRIKRTLAKVYLAQHKDNQALSLLNDIVEQATELKQFSDLEEFNQIISQYFAEKNQFESAYQFQVQRFDAAKQAAEKLNNDHFMQYKARITAQSELIDPPESARNINQSLIITALIILMMSIGLVLFITRNPRNTNNVKNNIENQQLNINNMLDNAKRGHYQLSMLLIDMSHILATDMPFITPRLKNTLREQDQVFSHSANELIILLPHTSPIGAARVVSQIEHVLEEWQTEGKVNIGVASLHQLDSFDALLKKAVLNQLNKIKSQEHNQKL